MDKKAYFFTIDAFVAMGVVVVGIVLFLSYYSFQPYEAQTLFFSNDIMSTMSSTKIYEINDDMNKNPYLSMYKREGSISNFENTVLEQLVEFIYTYENGGDPRYFVMAQNLTREISEPSVADQYSFNITIVANNNYTLHTRTSIDPLGNAHYMQNSSIILASKKIVSLLVDETDLVVNTIEVSVWQ